MNLQEAIDAPSFHTEHFPESFFPRKANPGKLVLESRFEETIIRELEERGHQVQVGDDWSEGRMCAVSQKRRTLQGCCQSKRNAGLRSWSLRIHEGPARRFQPQLPHHRLGNEPSLSNAEIPASLSITG